MMKKTMKSSSLIINFFQFVPMHFEVVDRALLFAIFLYVLIQVVVVVAGSLFHRCPFLSTLRSYPISVTYSITFARFHVFKRLLIVGIDRNLFTAKDIKMSNQNAKYAIFFFSSSGARALSPRGRGDPARVLPLDPRRQGRRVQLEEADLQDHRALRRAHPGILQDAGVPQAARVEGKRFSSLYKRKESRSNLEERRQRRTFFEIFSKFLSRSMDELASQRRHKSVKSSSRLYTIKEEAARTHAI